MLRGSTSLASAAITCGPAGPNPSRASTWPSVSAGLNFFSRAVLARVAVVLGRRRERHLVRRVRRHDARRRRLGRRRERDPERRLVARAGAGEDHRRASWGGGGIARGSGSRRFDRRRFWRRCFDLGDWARTVRRPPAVPRLARRGRLGRRRLGSRASFRISRRLTSIVLVVDCRFSTSRGAVLPVEEEDVDVDPDQPDQAARPAGASSSFRPSAVCVVCVPMATSRGNRGRPPGAGISRPVSSTSMRRRPNQFKPAAPASAARALRSISSAWAVACA